MRRGNEFILDYRPKEWKDYITGSYAKTGSRQTKVFKKCDIGSILRELCN